MTVRTLFGEDAVSRATNAGVPLANIMAPLAGILAILGGLSVAIGYKAKAGAWMLILFLVPVTFTMHAFWKQADPAQMQKVLTDFLKNLSLMGSAFMITYFGAGPLSVDSRLAMKHTPYKLKASPKDDASGRKVIYGT